MILDEVKDKAVPILRRAKVKRAAVFGSAARGDAAPGDVDLLVEMPRPYGLFAFLSLKLELEEALDRKVDLVEYSTVKPAFRDRALAEAIALL